MALGVALLLVLSLFAGVSAAPAASPAASFVPATMPTFPTGCTSPYGYISYNLWNNQSQRTGVYQQMVVMHLNNVSVGFSSNLSNLEVAYGNGTAIPAWIEANASSSAVNVTMWLRLNSIPALTMIVLYFFACSSYRFGMMGPTGEAPQLSARYGQLDNGAQVFNFYDNFSGTVLNTNLWDIFTSWDGAAWDGNLYYRVNNGFDANGTPSGGTYGDTIASTASSSNFGIPTNTAGSTIATDALVSLPSSFGSHSVCIVGFSGYCDTFGGASGAVGWVGYQNLGLIGGFLSGASNTFASAGYEPFWQNQVLTTTYTATYDIYHSSPFVANYTVGYSTTPAVTCGSYVCGQESQDTVISYLPATLTLLGGFHAGTNFVTNFTEQWVRERTVENVTLALADPTLFTLASVPPAPTGLVVTTLTNISVGLGWTQSTGGGILNNTLQFYTGAGCAGGATLYSTIGAATAATVGALSPGTVYSATVTSWNVTGESPASNCATFTTQSAVSPPPPIIGSSFQWLPLAMIGLFVLIILSLIFYVMRVRRRTGDR